MSNFNKFNYFVQDVANKVHNLGADQIAVILCETAPVATDHLFSDLSAKKISMTNLSSPNITTTSSTQTGGTYNLKLSNLTLTASGTVPQFRYVVVYNSSAASQNLIGYYDYGSELNMNVNDTLVISFDGTNGLISLA